MTSKSIIQHVPLSPPPIHHCICHSHHCVAQLLLPGALPLLINFSATLSDLPLPLAPPLRTSRFAVEPRKPCRHQTLTLRMCLACTPRASQLPGQERGTETGALSGISLLEGGAAPNVANGAQRARSFPKTSDRGDGCDSTTSESDMICSYVIPGRPRSNSFHPPPSNYTLLPPEFSHTVTDQRLDLKHSPGYGWSSHLQARGAGFPESEPQSLGILRMRAGLAQAAPFQVWQAMALPA